MRRSSRTSSSRTLPASGTPASWPATGSASRAPPSPARRTAARTPATCCSRPHSSTRPGAARPICSRTMSSIRSTSPRRSCPTAIPAPAGTGSVLTGLLLAEGCRRRVELRRAARRHGDVGQLGLHRLGRRVEHPRPRPLRSGSGRGRAPAGRRRPVRRTRTRSTTGAPVVVHHARRCAPGRLARRSVRLGARATRRPRSPIPSPASRWPWCSTTPAEAPAFAQHLAWELAAIASKAPATDGAAAPEAGLPWTAQQYHDTDRRRGDLPPAGRVIRRA